MLTIRIFSKVLCTSRFNLVALHPPPLLQHTHINVTLRFQYSHINPIGGDFYVAAPPPPHPSNTIRICQLWMRSLSSTSMHTHTHTYMYSETREMFFRRNEKCAVYASHIKSSFEGINDDRTAFLHVHASSKNWLSDV